MYRYRINKLTFNDGFELIPGNLLVLVGPNNSGKSRALRDIITVCAPPINGDPRTVVISDAEWSVPTSIGDVADREKLQIYEDTNGIRTFRTLDPNLTGERNQQVTGWKDEQFEDLLKNKRSFGQYIGSQFIGHLNTQNRLQLVQQAGCPSLPNHSTHLLHSLYWAGKEPMKTIQKTIKAQFNLDIVLDYSTLTQLAMRVGRDMKPIPDDPREAFPILSEFERLDEQGDGIRSFVGIMTALVCGMRDVLLVDEPEAFLHPPQAYRLGELLADSATNEMQMVVATHSSDVLQGMLAKGRDATILRIDRVGDKNLFRVLDKNDLTKIAGDPLLQSSRVLDGIFYPAALVVEADSDARFYHSASQKILPNLDLHTVNAQNKQTVTRIGSLYRQLGIRCAALVDFDVLNDSQEFRQQIEALGPTKQQLLESMASRDVIASYVESRPILDRLDEAVACLRGVLEEIDSAAKRPSMPDRNANETLMRNIVSRCSALIDTSKPWNKFKQFGREALPADIAKEFDEISKTCSSLGLIINPHGELESLLVDQGIEYTKDKKSWIQRALLLLPNLQVDPARKLWQFMNEVRTTLLEISATAQNPSGQRSNAGPSANKIYRVSPPKGKRDR